MTGRKRVPAAANCQIRLSDQERRSTRHDGACPPSAAGGMPERPCRQPMTSGQVPPQLEPCP